MSLACCRDEVNASKRRSSTKSALNGGFGSHEYQWIILPYPVENLTMHCVHARLRLRPDTSSIQQVAVDLVDPGAVYPARGSVLFLTICLKLWAVSLVKHQRRLLSQRKPQIHKPVPREALHITAARDQFGGHGASVIRAWSRIPGRASDVPGGTAWFQGGSPDADLASPGFQESQGPALQWGPSFLDVTRAAALLDMVTVVLGPNCPTVLKHSAPRPYAARSLSHAHPPLHFAAQPTQISTARHRWGRDQWTWSRRTPHDAMLP